MPFSSQLAITAATAGLLALSHAADTEARANRSHRQIPSWYLAISGSASFVSDADVTENTGGAIASGSTSYDDGYGIAGAIGYRPRYTNSMWDQTRFELELGLLDNDIDQLGLTSNAITGDIQSQRMMANIYLDLTATQQLRPYIGGGIGLARMHAEDDEDTAFAYQAMAGMYYTPASFPLIEVGAGYRYLSVGDVSFTSATTGSTVEIEYDAHVLEAGLRLYF